MTEGPQQKSLSPEGVTVTQQVCNKYEQIRPRLHTGAETLCVYNVYHADAHLNDMEDDDDTVTDVGQ